MGFPVGYSESVIPKLIVHTISALNFIISIIFSLFRHPVLSPPTRTPPDPIGTRHSPTAGSPVPALLIRDLLPVIKFEELCRIGSGEPPESCAVCLSEFEGWEEIRRLKNCQHMFHRACLDRWMDQDRMTCPLCRAGFVPEEMREKFGRRLAASYGVYEFYSGYGSVTEM